MKSPWELIDFLEKTAAKMERQAKKLRAIAKGVRDAIAEAKRNNQPKARAPRVEADERTEK